MLPAGVVKGGAAIKLRVGDGSSRLTTDLDAAIAATHTVESYIAELSDHTSTGWNGFTARIVDRDPADPQAVPVEYVMRPFDVKLSYNGQSFATVRLELGHDEVGSTERPLMVMDADIAEVIERLGLPTPELVPVLAVEHQIAQKLHACTTPDRHGGNQRAHDLVDIQVLVAADPPDLCQLSVVGQRLFAARRVSQWPPIVRPWPGWDEMYADAADGLEVLSLAEAVAWANDLVENAERSRGRCF